MQRIELTGEEKTEYKTIHDNQHMHIFNLKKVTTKVDKRAPRI